MTKYLITVSVGRTNLHTFGKLIEAERLGWFPETHASPKQIKERLTTHSPFGVQSWPPPPRRDLGTPLYDELGDGPIRLAKGVEPTGATLTVILDALRHGGRHKVDLDDLKVVLSQLGSLIARLDDLGGDQRRHAAAALYALILHRCTTL